MNVIPSLVHGLHAKLVSRALLVTVEFSVHQQAANTGKFDSGRAIATTPRDSVAKCSAGDDRKDIDRSLSCLALVGVPQLEVREFVTHYDCDHVGIVTGKVQHGWVHPDHRPAILVAPGKSVWDATGHYHYIGAEAVAAIYLVHYFDEASDLCSIDLGHIFAVCP